MRSSLVRPLVASVAVCSTGPDVGSGTRRLLRLLTAGIAVFAACGQAEEPGPPQGPTLVVFPDTVRIPQFGSQQLAAALIDSVGVPLPGVTFAFTAQNSAIAVVSNAGVVESVGPAGEASVTVGGGGLTRGVPVFVAPVPSQVVITPAYVRVPQGKSVQVVAVVKDAVGDPIPDADVVFTTGNGLIATVSPGGEVTGVGLGTTQLTVTGEGISAGALVTVVDSAIIASTPLGGRPFGVAVAASGAGYVLQQDLARMARITLPSAGVVTSVAVGAVPTAAAFHPDGATAYVTNQFSQSVSVVDVASNSVTRTFSVSGDPFYVAAAPDGARLWVTLNTGTVVVIELATGQPVATIPVGSAPNGIAFHPTQPIAYVSAAWAGTVSEVSTATLVILRTFPVGGSPQGLAIAPDGAELYIANEGFGLQIWDPVADTAITTVNIGSGAFGLALSPDNTRLAVTLPSGQVTFIDRATRMITKTVVTGGLPRRIAFGPGGTVVVVPNEAGWFDLVAN